MILQEIIENKRTEIAERQQRVPLETLQLQVQSAPAPRSMTFDGEMSLIAEVKRRSPSQGTLASAIDPMEQARAYERGGAAAISVLTDERFFGGSFEDLRAVRDSVEIPVLCKDFILTPYQVYEARAQGADVLLLIVSTLDDETLITLHKLVLALGMAALVEVHDQHDLARAIAAEARLIGINNRDLTDFSVDLVTTEYLAPLVPDDVVVVSESGVATRQDVQRAAAAGARAVLVGEILMRSEDPAGTIQELLG